MNESTSLALRICLFTGIVVLAVGLMFPGQDIGDRIIWNGLLILVLSPFAGILVAYVYLIAEKDWKWVKVATVLVVLIVAFLIFSLWKN
jgi:hypothetical protein